jgi:hypothetical protein
MKEIVVLVDIVIQVVQVVGLLIIKVILQDIVIVAGHGNGIVKKDILFVSDLLLVILIIPVLVMV